MTCDLAHERLLAEPAFSPTPDDLRVHLEGCPACQSLAKRIKSVDRLVRSVRDVNLPDSTPAKAAFIASLEQRQSLPSSLVPTDRQSRGRAYLVTAMLAASVLIAVGVMAMWPKPGQIVSTTKPASRESHRLLADATKFLCDQATKPERRAASATHYAGQLVSEVRGIYQTAGPDDPATVRVLVDLTQRVLDEALADAALPTHPAERKAILDPLMGKLAGIRDAARAMTLNAPVHHRDSIAKLQQAVDQKLAFLVSRGAAEAAPSDVPVASDVNTVVQLAMIRQNRAMIEILTDRGLKSAIAPDAVARANELRLGSQTIENALGDAIARKDVGLTDELAGQLAAIYTDGLTPVHTTIVSMNHNPESPSFARTQEWKAKAAQDVARVRAILPEGASETARQKLIDATSKML